MATNNGGETLPRVLAAHTRMESPPGGWKLVVIDNASDDDSAAIVAGFADRLPLRLLHEPRRGKNHALNLGLREIEGDLVVCTDDDAVPDPDWLVRMRAAADAHPDYDIFGGRILPHWDEEPAPWIRETVPAGPVFGVSEPGTQDGACDPTRVWGPNMAIRADWFRKGYRFDDRVGPNRSRVYAMGSETELTLRLSIAERVRCWHCAAARVHHIIRRQQLTRSWILRRAFRLGRCVRRESEQCARGGQPHVRRDAARISRELASAVATFARAVPAADQQRMFQARWNI